MTEQKKRKKRGERSDGLIQVTVRVGTNNKNGMPIRKSFYGHTRAEAERKRSEYLDSLKKGIMPPSGNITLSEWLDRWTESYDINTHDYNSYIERLRKDCGSYSLQSITEEQLQRSLKAYTNKSKSGATKYRMIIKRVFHKAAKNRLIPYDPADELELPEVNSGTHRALARWEIDSIMQYWRIHTAGRWAMLMLLCGLRRGEMAALEWKDVDLKNRTITVHQAAYYKNGVKIKDRTKTAAGMRVLPICQPLYDMLLETPEHERNGFVCRAVKGGQITPTVIRSSWKTYCAMMTRMLSGEPISRAGSRTDIKAYPVNVNRIEFSCQTHDLRHTFATMLFEGGVDVKAAQYFLGHSDLRMTLNIYTHLMQEKDAERRSKFTNYLDAFLGIKPPDDQ